MKLELCPTPNMLIQWYLIYFIVWFYGDCFQSWFTFSTCKLLFAPGDRWKALSEEEKDKYRNLSRADFEKARKQCLDASVPLRPSQLQQSGSTTSEVETSSPEVPTEDMVYLGNVHRIVDHAHGKGSYGTVYKVLHTPSFRFLAAKVETVGTSLKHEIQMLSFEPSQFVTSSPEQLRAEWFVLVHYAIRGNEPLHFAPKAGFDNQFPTWTGLAVGRCTELLAQQQHSAL